MGYNERAVGGGPAKGLAEAFTGFLENFMQSGQFGAPSGGKGKGGPSLPGSFGALFSHPSLGKGGVGGGSSTSQFQDADPANQSAGIFGLLNSLISNPSADAGVQELVNKDIERGRNDLRSKFGAGGGMGFGTPAAFAEGLYQAEQAPRTAIAMDEMSKGRINALMPFFSMIQNLSSLGIPQAQATLQPSGAMQGFNMLMDVANTAANFIPMAGGGETNRAGGSTTGGALKRAGQDYFNPRSNFIPLPVGGN